MRHGLAGNKLSRNKSLRKATMRDIAISTLRRQRITTTKAIAKEGRKLVEKLITMGKKGTLNEKRMAFSVLCDHGLVHDLFEKIAPRFKNRQGGYTRIITLGQRRGDNASMVILELTEKEAPLNKPKVTEKTSKKPKVVDVAAETEDKGETKKSTPKQPLPTEEKSKAKPKVGLIKKMFQRKVGEG